MVAPIVNQPVLSFSTAAGPGSVYYYRERTKQSKPYNLPTAAITEKNLTTISTAYGFYTPGTSWASASANSTWPKMGSGFGRLGGSYDKELYLSQAVNLARDKFLGTYREEAMLAVNYAERSQAIGMITKRALQLTSFTRAVRRGRISDAADILGVTKPPNRGRKYVTTKSWADTWLEFHFGWDPLVKDIHTAMTLLSVPLPTGDPIRVASRGIPVVTKSTEGSGYTLEKDFQGKTRAYMGGSVLVTNPNLWLLNQLGLLNPAGVVWELTPWSFIWDWFFNVGNWLNQWTDFAGLTVNNAWHSTIHRGHTRVKMTNGNAGYYIEQSGAWFTRKLGIPSVTLGKIPYKPLSLVRGATAVALLTQKLPSRESRVMGRRDHTPKWAS